MCGIYGIVSKELLVSDDKETLHRMGKALHQRGPDDQREYIKEQAGLGATRLSIIDLQGGNQPLFNEDKSIWAIQNGELYNYRELVDKLKTQGHNFLSSSDTEVYAHLYEELGLKFVNKLRGMFAIALWDENQKQLILVRDRLGIKPLYYVELNGQFIFASEIKALLQTNVQRKLNQQAFYDFLSVNYVAGPGSIFMGINKLPAGHLLVWKNGKMHIHQYWQGQTLIEENQALNESELTQELLNKLKESVKYHLVSDVPVGAFLSGGIDSSAVVALASQLYSKKLKTFSVGFKEKSYDELAYAKIVAAKYGTDHYEIQLSLKPQELVEKIGAYFDEPFADSSAVAVYAISQVARSQVKVVLSGDGGDEIFGGYVTYQADQLLRVYKRLPQLIREKIIAALVGKLPATQEKMAWEFKAKRFVRGALENPLKAHFLWKMIFTDEQIRQLLIRLPHIRPTVRLWEKVFDRVKSEDILSKLMLTDIDTSLVDDMLTKVDRMSMANSLEVRVPLLDHKLVEFMLALPSKYKIRGLKLKYLLKRSLHGLLPDEILNRPKAGFHVPVAHWIKNELKDLVGDYLSSARLKREGNFNVNFVQQILRDHQEMKADYSREIWGLVMFEIWADQYLRTT